MSLQVADIGIDYSFSRFGFSDLDKMAAQIAKDGAKFVCRYSAGDATNTDHPSHKTVAGKLITPAEFKALTAHKIDIIANDEWYETRVTEGYAAGRLDAIGAAKLWKSCGYRKGAVIVVSWDSAPLVSQYSQVARYLTGYNDGLADYSYKLGLYAGSPALRYFAHVANTLWRPNARSWSNDGIPYQAATRTPELRDALAIQAAAKTPAHILQTGNYWYGKNADENLILRPNIPSHFGGTVPPTPPTPPAPYPHSSAAALLLVSKSAEYSLWLLDDGRLEVRHNHEHFRYL